MKQTENLRMLDKGEFPSLLGDQIKQTRRGNQIFYFFLNGEPQRNSVLKNQQFLHFYMYSLSQS